MPALAAPPKKRPQTDQTATADPILPPQSKQYPVGTTWVLRSFNDKPIPFSDDLTFAIDKNYRGSGYSGCNTWSATIYPIKDQKFLVGPIATTRKQCDKARMEFEHTYLSAIAARPAWDLVNGNLVMKIQNVSLVFQRSL
jgi:heat shock protein HslJ